MSARCQNRDGQAYASQRVWLLALLFALIAFASIPSTADEPDGCGAAMARTCGNSDSGCGTTTTCASNPEFPPLDEFTLPAENLTSQRQIANPPEPAHVLYVVVEPLMADCSHPTSPDPPLVFEPLRDLGPASAAHAPPVV